MRTSVVLVTYNGAPYVEEQLASILDQSRPPDELVLRDDASSDDTVARARRLLAARSINATIVAARENGGVVANVEAALALATGELIFLADQDDAWHPTKIERMLPHFADGRVDAVFSNGDVVDEAGRPLGYTLWDWCRFDAAEQVRFARGEALPVVLRRNVATGAALAFRSSFRDRALPLPRSCLHDEWLALLAAAGGGLALEPTCLIRYRQHGANQVGAARRSLRARMRDARRTDNGRRLDDQLATTRAAIARVTKIPGGAAALAHLEARAHHLERRRAAAALPLAQRLGPVARELGRGGYQRFADPRHALRDLLAPRSSSTSRGVATSSE
jgi:hypothetical protein